MEISVEIIAKELGKSLENLSPLIESELKYAVESLANATYAGIIAKVQSMNMDPKNRQDYLRGLNFTTLDDSSWLIHLDSDWGKKLEEGFEGYSIKEKLLASKKVVAVGSRAGQPWVQKSKKGKRYAAVPFDHKPFSGQMSGDLSQDIKKILVKNQSGGMQSITKVFKDLEGKPLSGKVAVGPKIKDNPNLSNLTKYQHVSASGKVSSTYLTFRIVHEDSAKWQHPGFKGYQLFKEAEQYVEEELKNIIKSVL